MQRIYIHLLTRKVRLWWKFPMLHNKIKRRLAIHVRLENGGQFYNFLHITSKDLEILFNFIRPKITKQNTHFRKAIPAAKRLALKINFSASGNSFTSLQYLFKI